MKRKGITPPRRIVVDALKILLGEDLGGLGPSDVRGQLELRVLIVVSAEVRLQSRSSDSLGDSKVEILEKF